MSAGSSCPSTSHLIQSHRLVDEHVVEALEDDRQALDRHGLPVRPFVHERLLTEVPPLNYRNPEEALSRLVRQSHRVDRDPVATTLQRSQTPHLDGVWLECVDVAARADERCKPRCEEAVGRPGVDHHIPFGDDLVDEPHGGIERRLAAPVELHAGPWAEPRDHSGCDVRWVAQLVRSDPASKPNQDFT